MVPGSAKLGGQPIDPAANYRVTVNHFVAAGGDSFLIFKEGKDTKTGMMDIDAFELFIKNNPGLMPGVLDRVTRLN